jgi:hypothetical protein
MREATVRTIFRKICAIHFVPRKGVCIEGYIPMVALVEEPYLFDGIVAVAPVSALTRCDGNGRPYAGLVGFARGGAAAAAIRPSRAVARTVGR